ncbi:MAG: YidB family protein [Pseudomonadota bacterium]
MSILDGVLGGLVSAGVTSLVSEVIKKHGGIEGIASQFEKGGLGSVVQSWIGTGANQAVNPSQISQVLGSGVISELAKKLGISENQISEKLAEHLPTAIDSMTPNGAIPVDA